MSSPMAGLARLLGCTEGQAYTVSLGLVLALTLGVLGVPPEMQAGPRGTSTAAPVAPAAPASHQEPVPTSEVPSTFPSLPPSGPVGLPVLDLLPPDIGEPEPEPPPEEEPPPFGTVRVFAATSAAPVGVAADDEGRVYVTVLPSRVVAFAPSGTVERTFDIAGTQGLAGVALDASGGLIVLDGPTARVVRVDLATGAQSLRATIPDLPVCLLPTATGCEPIQDHAPKPVSASFDAGGSLYVTDAAQATIWRLPPGAAPEVWYQSVDLATGDGPAGIAVDTDGTVVFSATITLDPTNLGRGGVYRLPVTEAGAPGARSLVASFVPTDRPHGIALGLSGRIYVSLHGADVVVVLAADGAEAHRFANPNGAAAAFDGPSGVAFRGESLLVANQGAAAPTWAVLGIAVEDRAA